jgi:thiol-disulfide isomerase/thioredoxin
MRWTVEMIAVAVLFFSIAFSLPAHARPKVFSDLKLAQAQAKAKQSNMLVIVDFTASWCGPCRLMDRETWTAPDVEKWIAANALAVQIDVDAEHDLARSMAVNSMPTVVVFAPPDPFKEREREIGYKDPEELLDWLEGVKSGKQINRETAKYDRAKGKGGPREVHARLEQADMMMRKRDFAGAMDEFIWLWNNIEKEAPRLRPLRDSALAAAMGQLAHAYEPAREKFNELRTAAKDMDRTFDWVVLNDITGHEDETLSWFDSARNDPRQRAVIRELEPRIIDLLLEKGRYADAGRQWTDPRAELKSRYDWCQVVKRDSQDHPNLFPTQAGLMYSALLAAGRDKEAEAIATQSLQLENTPDLRIELSAVKQRVSGAAGMIWWLAGGGLLLAVVLMLLMVARKKRSS